MARGGTTTVSVFQWAAQHLCTFKTALSPNPLFNLIQFLPTEVEALGSSQEQAAPWEARSTGTPSTCPTTFPLQISLRCPKAWSIATNGIKLISSLGKMLFKKVLEALAAGVQAPSLASTHLATSRERLLKAVG